MSELEKRIEELENKLKPNEVWLKKKKEFKKIILNVVRKIIISVFIIVNIIGFPLLLLFMIIMGGQFGSGLGVFIIFITIDVVVGVVIGVINKRLKTFSW